MTQGNVPLNISVHSRQWGVGQGGFFTQDVRVIGQPEDLRFVYDCGTANEQTKVWRAVDAYVGSIPRGSTVHAIYLSHADYDHISGLKYLSLALKDKDIKVERTILPALSPLKKLFLYAAAGTNAPGWFSSLLVDPDSEIGELFPGSTVEKLDPTPPDAQPYGYDAGAAERPDGETLAERIGDGQTAVTTGLGGSVVQVWEVVPHVHESVITKTPEVLKALRDKFSNISQTGDLSHDDLVFLCDPANKAAVVEAVKRIRKTDATNFSSISLYTGAAYGIYCAHLDTNRGDYDIAFWLDDAPVVHGWLGTGDARFKTKRNVKQLVEFLGEDRLANIVTVSVPHHGSPKNSDRAFYENFPNSWLATIEVGSNSYMHPSPALTNMLQNAPLHLNVVQVDGEDDDFSTWLCLRRLPANVTRFTTPGGRK